ncbi:hypothetical protein PR048_028203 [Dryococelus australis]|uniref:Uncharacterized protein n=1 Tax=Dryococelus australis TaxID=614101 RepID=A0ABQ9GIL2_9NEOP|nr:hypothetical protein PR048_028203 [Dryococelus australis]
MVGKWEYAEKTHQLLQYSPSFSLAENWVVSPPRVEPGAPWTEAGELPALRLKPSRIQNSFRARNCSLSLDTAYLHSAAGKLASREGEPGSISGGIVPGFLHLRIVPDDVTGRRVFSRISSFLHLLHSGTARFSSRFTIIGFQYTVFSACHRKLQALESRLYFPSRNEVDLNIHLDGRRLEDIKDMHHNFLNRGEKPFVEPPPFPGPQTARVEPTTTRIRVCRLRIKWRADKNGIVDECHPDELVYVIMMSITVVVCLTNTGSPPGFSQVRIGPDGAAGRGGFFRGSPVSLAPAFRRRYYFTKLHPHRLLEPLFLRVAQISSLDLRTTNFNVGWRLAMLAAGSRYCTVLRRERGVGGVAGAELQAGRAFPRPGALVPQPSLPYIHHYRNKVYIKLKTRKIEYTLNLNRRVWSSAGMKGRGKKGDPREIPPTSGIVQHDSHVRKYGNDPAGDRASILQPACDSRWTNYIDFFSYHEGAAVAKRLDCSPPTKANRVQYPTGSLPDFQKWESFPPPFHPGLLKTTLLRAAPNLSTLNSTLTVNWKQRICSLLETLSTVGSQEVKVHFIRTDLLCDVTSVKNCGRAVTITSNPLILPPARYPLTIRHKMTRTFCCIKQAINNQHQSQSTVVFIERLDSALETSMLRAAQMSPLHSSDWQIFVHRTFSAEQPQY